MLKPLNNRSPLPLLKDTRPSLAGKSQEARVQVKPAEISPRPPNTTPPTAAAPPDVLSGEDERHVRSQAEQRIEPLSLRHRDDVVREAPKLDHKKGRAEQAYGEPAGNGCWCWGHQRAGRQWA